ncbi:MAG: hypothetical protein ABSB30_10925 [Terracidiphilus sp.]|jgi:hypothetical protein
MQWLNENAAGIQAITAIVIVALTSALVYVTWWYAKTLREQLAASFQPNVEMTLPDRFHGSGSDGRGGHSETVGGMIAVRNKGNLPLLVVTFAMKLIYDNAAFPVQTVTEDAKQRVVAPDETTQFILLTIDVPPGGSTAPHEQIAQIHCSDLAGVSKHSFSVSSREKNRTHHSCGFQPI